ncbi:Phospholipid/glycerol acyltransferase [Macleaya cordata]|uniref:Phospholipid/glycerol acyltransferase n=1 Tax=Macleaya cordata TaxID=56857 RepID=A0A200QSZ2_MACCD|nr:Phospholipid/glycerol acyltransferase [Macleaya cordata]
MGLQIMVMVCFFGIRKDSFRVGRAVLPKFFLEDVGFEGFEVLMRGGRKVGVTDFPRVMVESFLREYLEIDVVVGRELKVFKGYYIGLMEDHNNNKKNKSGLVLDEIFGEGILGSDVVGIGSFNKPLDHHLFSHCKEIYFVSEADKRSWHYLPRDKYPKPLIFHDGRLVLRPTPLNSLAIFMWVPFAFFLAIIRALVAISLPYRFAGVVLAFLGMRLNLSRPTTSSISSTTNHSNNRSSNPKKKKKGLLYVCNHRTLLDPLYLSAALCTPITAVTYSLSRLSEVLAPIKTVRLTRDRVKDAKMMEKLLSQGDLIVCPEGTTCREPYLLRFSPLFAEMSDEIVPVAMDAHVSMFYGTTAGGLKCLDPLFFLMNPSPYYTMKVLDKVPGASTCRDGDESSRFKVANHVQHELGKALGFECTKLTRKDKYLILAGNEGIVKGH